MSVIDVINVNILEMYCLTIITLCVCSSIFTVSFIIISLLIIIVIVISLLIVIVIVHLYNVT